MRAGSRRKSLPLKDDERAGRIWRALEVAAPLRSNDVNRPSRPAVRVDEVVDAIGKWPTQTLSMLLAHKLLEHGPTSLRAEGGVVKNMDTVRITDAGVEMLQALRSTP